MSEGKTILQVQFLEINHIQWDCSGFFFFFFFLVPCFSKKKSLFNSEDVFLAKGWPRYGAMLWCN